MGIITRIEDKLGNIVENPFKDRNNLDLIGIEVSLKRLIEGKKRDILGKVIVPNVFNIVINKREYEEYEVFLEKYKISLEKSLYEWMKEKGYEMVNRMELNFQKGNLGDKLFKVFVSYKKMNGDGRAVEHAKKGQYMEGMKEFNDGNKVIYGNLINKKTGEVFIINQKVTVVGREEDCTIRMDDPAISRKHVCLSYQYGKIILEDLGSKSGTRVNHERVHRKNLCNGDRIMIASTELMFIEVNGIVKGIELDSPSRDKIRAKIFSDPNIMGLSYFF